MPYRLAIFDMDGTLTEELLDFAAIRSDLGLSEKCPILEAIATLPTHLQPDAHAILHRHEMSAAESCRLHDGAADLLSALHHRGIFTALLTRNSRHCAHRILERHKLVLDHIATRDDAPHKPHPDSILNIARKFAVPASQTLMIGDYLYDLQAAHAAGVDSALLCPADPDRLPPFAPMATYRIHHLRELLPILAS